MYLVSTLMPNRWLSLQSEVLTGRTALAALWSTGNELSSKFLPDTVQSLHTSVNNGLDLAWYCLNSGRNSFFFFFSILVLVNTSVNIRIHLVVCHVGHESHFKQFRFFLFLLKIHYVTFGSSSSKTKLHSFPIVCPRIYETLKYRHVL